MKQAVLYSLLFLSFSSFAAEECKPVYKSTPLQFTVSAKNNKDELHLAKSMVIGNELSPIQPSETVNHIVGTLNFSITPVNTCKDGVNLEFVSATQKKQQFLPWGKVVLVDGHNNTDYFVNVTVDRVKQ